MTIFRQKKELLTFLRSIKRDDSSVGFVPTMGALHQGHLSLVHKSLSENDISVVSIFVNPTQFDSSVDLNNYPKSLKADLSLLENTSSDLCVFTPTKEEMYDGRIVAKTYDFNGLDQVMEGTYRKGHFNGVATVVELLLRTVQPDKAYFGEKDFQQLQIIKKLVAQLDIPCLIIGCPIEREHNGLARSSRNERLPSATRKKADIIYTTLQTAKKKFGTESAIEVKEWVYQVFAANALFEIEYFEIAEERTLRPVQTKQPNEKYRAFIAVYAQDIRLIDNLALN